VVPPDPGLDPRLSGALIAALRGKPRIVALIGSQDRLDVAAAAILSGARDAGATAWFVPGEPTDRDTPFAALGRLAGAVMGLPGDRTDAAGRLADIAAGVAPGIMPGSVFAARPAAGYFQHLLGFPISVPDLNGMDAARLGQGASLALGDLLVEAAHEAPVVAVLAGMQWAAPATFDWFSRMVHRLAAEDQSVRLLLALATTRPLPAFPARPGGDLEILTIALGGAEPAEQPEAAPPAEAADPAGSAVSADPHGAADFASAQAADPAAPETALQALLAEAAARQAQGDHRDAISLARRALVGFEALGRPVDAASAHGLAGNCYQRLGEWELAQLEHEAALAIRERIGDVPGIATSLNNLAILSASLGRWQGAQQYYLRSLALARRTGEFRAVAIVLGNLGELLLARGDDAEAERRLLEGLEIAVRTGDSEAETVIVGNLAAVYLARNAPAQALEALDQCLRLIERTGRSFYATEVHFYRGRAFQLLGNVSEARREHDRARYLATAQGHVAYLGVVDRALAELAESSGRKEEAFELALRSERALRPAGMPLEHARTLAVLARLARPGKREEWAQAALAYFERLGARREVAKMRDEVPIQSRLSGGSEERNTPSGPRSNR